MGDSDFVRWPWFTMKLTSNQHQMINRTYLKLLIFFANLVKNPSRTAHSRNFPVAICAPYHCRRRAWLMEFMLKPGQTREQKSTQPCDHHLYRLGVILDSFTLNKTTPNGLSLIVQRESDAVMCAHFLTFPSPRRPKILCSKFTFPAVVSGVGCQCVNPRLLFRHSVQTTSPARLPTHQLRDFMSHSNSHKTAINRQKQSSDIMIITIAITIPFILT